MNFSTVTHILLFVLQLHNSLLFRKMPNEPDRQQQRLPSTTQPNAASPISMLDT